MKNMKLKALSLSILSVIFLSSIPTFAATATSNINNDPNLSYRSLSSDSKSSGIITQFTQDKNGDLGFLDTIDNGRIIQNGNVGLAVKQLQFLLKWQGYNINADGKFGTDTYNAVQSFQEKNNLTRDGKVGKATENKLIDLAGGSLSIYWNNKTGVAFIMDSNNKVIFDATIQ